MKEDFGVMCFRFDESKPILESSNVALIDGSVIRFLARRCDMVVVDSLNVSGRLLLLNAVVRRRQDETSIAAAWIHADVERFQFLGSLHLCDVKCYLKSKSNRLYDFCGE